MSKEYQIFHIYHSGVAIKHNSDLFIFDYFQNGPTDKSGLASGKLEPSTIKAANRVFIFVSHSHHDHFNPQIFSWSQYNPQTYYILSSDLVQKDETEHFYLGPDENLELAGLNISTYGSTDQGVSFLVKTPTLTVFHAGDLNWWHWKKFSKQQQQQEKREYQAEVEKLRGTEIDIACIPVDPRLEEYYYLAGEYFAQKIKPKLIVPIHFKDNYYITTEFATKIEHLATAAAIIKQPGEVIL